MTIELNGTSLQEGAMDGLTLLEVYVGAEKIWPTTEVHEVSLTNVQGTNTAHSLASVTVPAGKTWSVRIQGTITKAPRSSTGQPVFRIGASTSGRYGNGATVNYSGTITAANSTIAMVTAGTFSLGQASFTGTVTIEK